MAKTPMEQVTTYILMLLVVAILVVAAVLFALHIIKTDARVNKPSPYETPEYQDLLK